MRFRTDDLAWREIDGDLVILDLKSSTYLTANASATVLMKQLISDSTQAELVQALVDAFGTPESQAEKDVLGFLGVLESHGLLDRHESTSLPDR